MNEFICLTEK